MSSGTPRKHPTRIITLRGGPCDGQRHHYADEAPLIPMVLYLDHGRARYVRGPDDPNTYTHHP